MWMFYLFSIQRYGSACSKCFDLFSCLWFILPGVPFSLQISNDYIGCWPWQCSVAQDVPMVSEDITNPKSMEQGWAHSSFFSYLSSMNFLVHCCRTCLRKESISIQNSWPQYCLRICGQVSSVKLLRKCAHVPVYLLMGLRAFIDDHDEPDLYILI